MINNIQKKDNKYKDRTPETTIQIIEDFFKNKNCELKEILLQQSESGSWSSSYQLFYQNQLIGRSNGKGATKLFNQASGHAEIYERYCNRITNIFRSYLPNRKFKDNNFKKYGYYLSPNEKEITYEEGCAHSERIASVINAYDDDKGNSKKYWSLLLNNKFIALPYQHFTDDKEQYFIPEFVLNALGSDGMAAGNTLEEALVQGASEVCEHYIWNQVNQNHTIFYNIDLDSLSLSKYLQDMIHAIKLIGYKLYCIDYSRLYNIPVLGLLIVDQVNSVSYLNLGSHPVFEIALERIITEIYQGSISLLDQKKRLMAPYREYGDIHSQLLVPSSICLCPSMLEELFLNMKTVNTINTEIFLEANNYDNIYLKKYYDNLFNKLNWDVYYYDWSLSKDIFAIQIILSNKQSIGHASAQLVHDNLTNNEKTLLYKKLFQNTQEIIKLYEENNFNYDNLFIFNTDKLTFAELLFIGGFLYIDFGYLYIKQKVHMYKLLTLLDTKNLKTILNFYTSYDANKEISPFLFEVFKHYRILLAYGYFSSQYSIDEIKKIAKFYNIEYTDEDYLNMSNKIYYINKISETVYNELNSPRYNNFINMFGEKI